MSLVATLTPEQVIRSYNGAVAAVRAAVVSYATSVWGSAGSWRDADVDRLVKLILPKVQAGQLQTARLTAAYVASLAAAVDGRMVKAASVVADDIILARGVSQGVVYRRPATQMYTALSQGSTLTQAVTQGVNRLQSIIKTDMQLAVTHQERRSYSRAGYEFTVRTLTGRENCALCAIASTQRYSVKVLRPIHPGCDCGSRQVSSKFRPPKVLDQKLLDETYALVDESDRDVPVDRLSDLVVTREHGEIGPVLTWRKQQFTSASDL